ncbi:MAG: bifunctional adenosylcobinamide kinase/adenosylcobinamide-phosphate guanylyltransferase [Gammaproteobacteria bacterium]|nr:bifunctional adenosylcobinamide kinase/adenosylcobinamide-phosphate guanylyltransferase [Gammaproteobacteria bacterium]
MTKELILGGARSGKSALAQQHALASGKDVTFIATATADDAEMAARIQHHQAERPTHWAVVEEPVALADVLSQHAAAQRCMLVDCLTLWLCNLIGGEDSDDALFMSQRDALLDVLPRLPGHIILVSNEVGLGVTPLGPLNRRFVDETGRLHQQLAALCDHVTLMVAGLPMALKQPVPLKIPPEI